MLYFTLLSVRSIMLQKAERRRSALKLTSWDEAKKKRVESVLRRAYMSSEDDDDERENTFITRPKPNISRKFKKYLKHLDKVASRGEAKKPRSSRVVGQASTHPLVPREGHEWIITAGDDQAEVPEGEEQQLNLQLDTTAASEQTEG